MLCHLIETLLSAFYLLNEPHHETHHDLLLPSLLFFVLLLNEPHHDLRNEPHHDIRHELCHYLHRPSLLRPALLCNEPHPDLHDKPHPDLRPALLCPALLSNERHHDLRATTTTFTVAPSFTRPSYATNPTTTYVTNPTLTYATTSPCLVVVRLTMERRKHYVMPAVTLEAIVLRGTLPPSTQPLQCNRCIHLGIP